MLIILLKQHVELYNNGFYILTCTKVFRVLTLLIFVFKHNYMGYTLLLDLKVIKTNYIPIYTCITK